MIQKVNSLSSNVYTSHGEILKGFFFFFKYVNLPSTTQPVEVIHTIGNSIDYIPLQLLSLH